MIERDVELSALGWLQSLGYQLASGTDFAPDQPGSERTAFNEVVLPNRLRKAISTLNPFLPASEVAQVVRTITRPPHPTLVQNNRWLHSLLTDGVPVEYRDRETKETRGGRAQLVDWNNSKANDWLAVQQLIVTGPADKAIRLDLLIFLNGLPLAVIELKNPADLSADLNVAIDQLGRYMQAVPDLFVPNLLMVASDGLLTRAGSITSGRSRYMPWRSAEGGEPTLESLIRELFEPSAFLEYLRKCVAFEEDERGNIVKKIAGYHQFRAVRKAQASVQAALQAPSSEHKGRRGGVIWHTQGSGKSLTMLMLAGALIGEPELANPTIVVVTDRNDLDDQLFNTFSMGRAMLRQVPIQAGSREHLAQLLDRASGGVIFTTIYKFTERAKDDAISHRSNIIVMADEAHRSQYGFKTGGAKWMRDALPNATFIGFTGTPLDRDDRNTIRVFGDYADVYDIRQAVADGATVPLFYESRVIKLTVDAKELADAEAKLAEAARAEREGEDVDEDVRIPLEHIVGAPNRIERLAAFIVEHWEKRRAAIEGKAMVVTMSRDIAARLYEAIRRLRPEWHDGDDERGAMKVIVTSTPEDEEPLKSHTRTKGQRKRLAERFKDSSDEFRLAIVCDMWLTGFDCPSAHTMYLDKPLAGHSLMQAIARVNRVFGDKPGGLIVDMLGLADQLADALAVYTHAGGTGDAVRNVQDEAVPAMQAAFEKLRSFFHGLDYESALDRPNDLRIYAQAADYVFAQEDGWKRLRQLVKECSLAFALAVPRKEADEIVDHLVFFQQVAAMIRKRLADESNGSGGLPRRHVDVAVRQIIGDVVEAGKVIDLFAVAGLDEARLDILSEEFLNRVAALEQKNLALETLRKLLSDQIRVFERSNVVRSRQFHEALEAALINYTNKAISTAEMIVRLLDLARVIREARNGTCQ